MSDKLKIFISYSRRDAVAADALVEALILRGFEVTIDRRDLPFGEKWQLELADFIRQSDTVVWLVSEASVRSEWVNWELDEVVRRNKRLVPVLIGDLQRDALPRQLGEIHMLPAAGLFELARDLDTLVGVIETDRAWLKEASRLQDRAAEWQANERASSLLLSRGALIAAEKWKDRRPAKAPAPAQEVLDLLLASRQAATRRQRLWIAGSVAVSVTAVALAVLALWQRHQAVDQRDQALRTQSLFLADLAQQFTNESDPVIGLHLALEALPDRTARRDRPYVADAERSLYRALYELNETAVLPSKRSVKRVAFSPRGLRALTVSADGTARIWDVTKGNLLLEIKAHEDNMAAFGAFNPDGTRIVTGSFDKMARIWDAVRGNLIADLRGHKAWVRHVEFSRDGRYVLTASGDPFSNDNAVRVWDAVSGTETARLVGHEKDVIHAAFSPDGKLVATGSADATVRIWDRLSGRQLRVLQDQRLKHMVLNVEFSPDGSLLLATPLNGSSVIWDVATGMLWGLLAGNDGHRNAVFAANGRYIATTAPEHIAHVFELDQAKFQPTVGLRILMPSHELRGHQKRIRAMEFARDGRRLTTVSDDGTARLWDVQSGTMIRVFKGHRASVEMVAIDPNGLFLLTGSSDGTARVWRLDHPDHIVLPNGAEVATFSLDDSGKRLLSVAPRTKTVRIWLGQEGKLIGELVGHKGPVGDAAYVAGGSRIVTIAGSGGDNERLARFFTADSLSLLATVQGTKGPFKQVSVSADGAFVALVEEKITKTSENSWGSENDDQILLVDAREPSRRRHLRGHSQPITHIRFSRDGQLLGSTSEDRSVRLWDVATGQLQMLLKGHEYPTTDVAFSPDSTLIATSSRDKTVRIWRRADGAVIHTLRGHSDWVNSVEFSPDGRWLAASVSGFTQENQEVRIWNVVSGEQLLRLESKSGGLGKYAQFSPDGTRILTIGTRLEDKTGKSVRTDVAQLWDVAKGERGLIVDYGSVQAARFSASGEWLIVASTDKTVRMLRLFQTLHEVMLRAKTIVKRCMTLQEREKAFLGAVAPDQCDVPGLSGN